MKPKIRHFNALFSRRLSLIKHCLLCHTPSVLTYQLCPLCIQDMMINTILCDGCAMPLQAADSTCKTCIARPTIFTQSIIYSSYQNPLTQRVIKKQKKAHFAFHESMAQLLATKINSQANALKPDLIIPVPAHHSKLRARGFNQASLLAKHLGFLLDLPVEQNMIAKTKATLPFSRLSKAHRKNLEANTYLYTGKRSTKVPHQKIAIVDDVLTTGTTTEAIGKLLLRSGTQEVYRWCFARTF